MGRQMILERLKAKLETRGGAVFLRQLSMGVTLVITSLSVAVVITLFLSTELYTSSRQVPTTFRARYFSMADSFTTGTIDPTGLADGLNLMFESLNRESEGQLAEYGYSSLLEDYVAQLLSDDTGDGDQYVPELMAVLAEVKAEEPFAGLPSESRRLFTNLSSAIVNGDQGMAQDNLSDIAIQMRTTSSVVSALRAQNGLMLGLAVAGLAATILMGVGTLVTGIWRRRSTRLAREIQQ